MSRAANAALLNKRLLWSIVRATPSPSRITHSKVLFRPKSTKVQPAETSGFSVSFGDLELDAATSQRTRLKSSDKAAKTVYPKKPFVPKTGQSDDNKPLNRRKPRRTESSSPGKDLDTPKTRRWGKDKQIDGSSESRKRGKDKQFDGSSESRRKYTKGQYKSQRNENEDRAFTARKRHGGTILSGRPLKMGQQRRSISSPQIERNPDDSETVTGNSESTELDSTESNSATLEKKAPQEKSEFKNPGRSRPQEKGNPKARSDNESIKERGSQEDKVKRETWQIQKEALKRKFGDEGWNPRKKVSPDAMEGIRALHAQDPEKFSTPMLAEQFEISAEAVRRILKSKWRPSTDNMDERRERWARRYDRIWDAKAELGLRPERRKKREVEEPDAFEEELRAKQMLRDSRNA